MYRAIPSIDKCLKAALAADASLKSVPRSLLKDAANAFWELKRQRLRTGADSENLDLDDQLPALLTFIHKRALPNLRPVLNGTGVIIHTNLGRSLLADAACEAVLDAARNYSTLELNLETGERGSRNEITCGLINRLTGAEDSMVVNNNAAAVLLILDTLCAGGEVIVSRGELVEIGGSFRIPDIMAKSGAVLKEVGTTNRTHLEDYRSALDDNTRAIMRVHASNFRIVGFQSAVDLTQLKRLAAESGLPLILDLGSGSLLGFSEKGLPQEPTVREVLTQGADIVCFSGDKALGGPQAGLIAGKKELVGRLRKNPLARALRCDKLCLAALEATLRIYLDAEKAKALIPTLAMISTDAKTLEAEARTLAAAIRRSLKKEQIACDVELRQDISRVGGGSFPGSELPSTVVAIKPGNMTTQQLRKNLLDLDAPLLGRVDKEAFLLDPRTLRREEYQAAAQALARALSD